MNIAGYLKTSLIEWPGKIASVIFTQGCNFRCPFCHNAELVEIEDPKMQRSKDVKIQRIDEKEILADLKRRKKWIEAVAITGGEPTLQEDLPEFLGKLGVLGFLRMVETNGSRPEVIARLVDDELVDRWGMDVKSNFDNYTTAIGIKNEKIKIKNDNSKLIDKVRESMGLIAGSGVEYEFRTTVVPGMHNLENLIVLAEEIREVYGKVPQVSQVPQVPQAKNTKHQTTNTKYPIPNNKCQPKWFLQQFRPTNCLDKSFLKKKGFTKEEMEEFLGEVKKIVPQTYLRGV